MENQNCKLEKYQAQELATITSNQFLEGFNLPAVNRICRKVNDFPEIFRANLPTISAIKKQYGYDFIQAYIEGWIVNLREFINVGKKMTDMQCNETAMLIVDEYFNLTIADINLIFKNAKLGKYGAMYDRLDGQMILSWFEKHFYERCSAAANMSVREAESFSGAGRVESFDSVASRLNSKFKFK